MTATAVNGVLPVFQTPYASDGSVDLETLEAEIRWIVEQGADGIVMGMVSEVLRLSDAEVTAVSGRACAVAAELGVQSILSVGAESTYVAVERARHAVDLGATAVMAIPPLATAVDDDEKLATTSHSSRPSTFPSWCRMRAATSDNHSPSRCRRALLWTSPARRSSSRRLSRSAHA